MITIRLLYSQCVVIAIMSVSVRHLRLEVLTVYDRRHTMMRIIVSPRPENSTFPRAPPLAAAGILGVPSRYAVARRRGTCSRTKPTTAPGTDPPLIRCS
jgi:hypothetical protein